MDVPSTVPFRTEKSAAAPAPGAKTTTAKTTDTAAVAHARRRSSSRRTAASFALDDLAHDFLHGDAFVLRALFEPAKQRGRQTDLELLTDAGVARGGRLPAGAV